MEPAMAIRSIPHCHIAAITDSQRRYANEYSCNSQMNRTLIAVIRVCIVPRMSIGNRLDQAMKAARIKSQSELSRASGVPQATISRILKGAGAKGPETETVKKLARACRVSFAWLNEGEEPEAGSHDAADLYLDKRIEHAIKLMQQMPEYKLNQVVKIIDAIAEPAPVESGRSSRKKS